MKVSAPWGIRVDTGCRIQVGTEKSPVWYALMTTWFILTEIMVAWENVMLAMLSVLCMTPPTASGVINFAAK